MDLVGVITNAGKGLGVFRAQVATASHNIAIASAATRPRGADTLSAAPALVPALVFILT